MHILSLFILFSLPYYTYCYCIYNQYSDGTKFWIRQIEGQGKNRPFSRFRKPDVQPGQKECCPYTEKTCAQSDPNGIVKFWVSVSNNNHGSGSFEIDCPAGGYILFGGTANAPVIQVKYADHAPYTYTIEHNPKSHWH